MPCASAWTAAGWPSPAMTRLRPRCAWRSLTTAAMNFTSAGLKACATSAPPAAPDPPDPLAPLDSPDLPDPADPPDLTDPPDPLDPPDLTDPPNPLDLPEPSSALAISRAICAMALGFRGRR